MNLEALERFVMDTIDVIFTNPREYEAEAVKSTVAYRFELHRKAIRDIRSKLKIHHLPPGTLKIPTPKIHRLTKTEIEGFLTRGDNDGKRD